MSVSSTPRILTFKASGAILPYSFVIFGATKDLVAQAGANGRTIGIYQGQTAAVDGDMVEVAINGGGALLTVSETVTLGKLLTATSTGIGEVADAAGEFCGAIAFEDGVANDIIGVEVIACQAVGSDA